jgi:hypothetical protein
MKRAALAVAVVLATGCGTTRVGGGGAVATSNGNPPGYTVHVLTGASLSAKDVTVNGRAIETTSVETIDASVQALRSETSALTTVAEVTGVVPDLTVDFTGPATPVPPTFHGLNIEWHSKFYFTNPRWNALVRHVKIASLASRAANNVCATTGKTPWPAPSSRTR